jgi:porin
MATHSAAEAAGSEADTAASASASKTLPDAPPKAAVEVNFLADLDLLRNVSGGMSTGGRPIVSLELDFGVDLDAAVGWPGSSALFSLLYDGGGRINAKKVGSLLGVSNIEVPVSTFRIYQAWLQKQFADGRASLLFGLYPIDTEFQILDSAAVFLQPEYGVTAELGFTRGPSIFDNTAVGVRAKLLSEDRSAYALGAVLDGVPGDPNNPKGTHIKFGRGDGIMSIAEIGFKPAHGTPWAESPAAMNQAKADRPGVEAADAIEKFALGYWRYSARVDDLIEVVDGAPTKQRSSGWYAQAERTLYRGGGDWAGFIRVSGTDGDSTPLKSAFNIGLSGRGIIPGRSEDTCGIAYSRATLSEKYRAVQARDGIDTTSYESAWELTYRIPLGKSLAIQPDLQRINHPGGDRATSAAVVIGARIEVSY